MKRQVLVALVSIAVIGAALWGVNWRLDHPPLSDADRDFRARVAGADGVIVRHKKPVGFVARGAPLQILDAAQTRDLIESLRFARTDSRLNVISLSPLELTFERHNKPLTRFELWQTPTATELQHLEPPYQIYQLHPRFEKPLRRVLSEVLPQHIRP